MLEPYIARLVERQDLSEEDCERAMGLIMSGKATEAQIAGFLVALRMKGETVAEITGCARAMRAAATKINVPGAEAMDTCGTGGDGRGTFNVSTAAAIVAAGAGIRVAKHGNRSVSSASGSADVFRALGVNIQAPPHIVEQCICEAGIGFLFAPMLHGAMKYAVGPRRELAIRTVFNILGPLTNPASVKHQLLGLFSKNMLDPIANVLKNLGCERALVVHSDDGLDELSICAPSSAVELRDGKLTRLRISPEDAGLQTAAIDCLLAKSAEESADIIRGVLAGKRGPQRDVVLLNAGAAIYVGGKAATVADGVRAAAESVDSGRAARALARLVEVSNRAPGS
jgi:anthranilate phosphoribosyltransferase